jgi:hypothetical protein
MKVQQKINEALQKEQSIPRIRSGKFSPSSFGKCFRNQYWNRKNETPSNPPDERALRIFKCGKIFHEFVQGLFPDAQIEVLIENENVKGFADLVDDDEVIDIKSQHTQAFWYMEKTDYDVSKEKYSNILQVMYYAMELGKEWGRLVFVSKDDLCIAEYKFHIDIWKDKVLKELDVIQSFWNLQEVPAANPRLYPYRIEGDKLHLKKSQETIKLWKEFNPDKDIKEQKFISGMKECGYCQFKDKCLAYGKSTRSD